MRDTCRSWPTQFLSYVKRMLYVFCTK